MPTAGYNATNATKFRLQVIHEIIANRLRNVAPKLIKKDQAGPRSISTSAGIRVWCADGCRRNIELKLDSHGNKSAFDLRAELTAILEALRQNEADSLETESHPA